ncbi:MAG: DUF4375 domain-containing protein [Verrucomicrobia bacterium]|nr:DUF4375 domain-containing protein [Verrucomicrobiota bacterium]
MNEQSRSPRGGLSEDFIAFMRQQMEASKQPPTKEVLMSMKPNLRTACIVGWVNQKLEAQGSASRRNHDKVLAALEPVTARFYLAHCVEAEVANGGFGQVLGNDPWIAPHLEEAAEGFESLTLPRAALAVRKLAKAVQRRRVRPGRPAASSPVVAPRTCAALDREFMGLGWCFERERAAFIRRHAGDFLPRDAGQTSSRQES